MSVLHIVLCLWVFSPAVKGVGLQKLVIMAVGEKSWVCLQRGRQGEHCGRDAAFFLGCSHCPEVSRTDSMNVSGIVELQDD